MMARVFRHEYTKVQNGQRLRHTTRKWYVEYTDANGRKRRVPGYTDKRATEALADTIQRQVDRQKAGIIDQQSLDLSNQLVQPIAQHIDAYEVNLRAKGVSAWHLAETVRRLKRVLDNCCFQRLVEIKSEPVQRWGSLRLGENMAPRTLNLYLASLRAFVRWCVADRRMSDDPLVTLSKADVSFDVRRRRRALTENEIARLLDVAQNRPLNDALMIRRGQHKGQLTAKLKPYQRQRLVRLGNERRLIYKTLILTGLRKGELTSMTWGDLDLDATQAWLTVQAQNAKNRKSESLPIRNDLVVELRQWYQESGQPHADAPVFDVPANLVAILKRDLDAAKIDKSGVDVHALRHTTATYLAKAGVAPRTAQSLMRHSDIRLTLGTYTDPRLLDTVAALNALPKMDRDTEAEIIRATGTEDVTPIINTKEEKLGVQLGVTEHFSMQNSSSEYNEVTQTDQELNLPHIDGEALISNDIQVYSKQRVNGFEPSTFSLEGIVKALT